MFAIVSRPFILSKTYNDKLNPLINGYILTICENMAKLCLNVKNNNDNNNIFC